MQEMKMWLCAATLVKGEGVYFAICEIYQFSLQLLDMGEYIPDSCTTVGGASMDHY